MYLIVDKKMKEKINITDEDCTTRTVHVQSRTIGLPNPYRVSANVYSAVYDDTTSYRRLFINSVKQTPYLRVNLAAM